MGYWIHLDLSGSHRKKLSFLFTRFQILQGGLFMAKRSKPSRMEPSEEPSPEDAKELARLLRIFSGRASASDWEPKEDQQQRG
jgi:hypothetical protein